MLCTHALVNTDLTSKKIAKYLQLKDAELVLIHF
jgi:hypothetical protein